MTLHTQHGSVDVREGGRTPWGPADHVSHPAPGLAQVSTRTGIPAGARLTQ
jgi:hypothetical protein